VRLLLDTHAFLWWLDGDPGLSEAAREAIGDAETEVFPSAASAWEISTKHLLGKLPGAAAVTAEELLVGLGYCL
jgi:PIN domain nuclease of toxin-antitoxin system